jgi:hypothetical protein
MTEDENESANRARTAAATMREHASSDEDSEERATPRLRAFYAWFGWGAIRSFRIYKRDGYVITVYDP